MTLAIGGCTVRELQVRMSSREFAEWQAFARLDPFGPARADLRMANQMALFAEVHRDRKKRSKAFTPADFMFEFDSEAVPDPEPPSPAALWQKIRGWAIEAGAKPKDGGQDGSSK